AGRKLRWLKRQIGSPDLRAHMVLRSAPDAPMSSREKHWLDVLAYGEPTDTFAAFREMKAAPKESERLVKALAAFESMFGTINAIQEMIFELYEAWGTSEAYRRLWFRAQVGPDDQKALARRVMQRIAERNEGARAKAVEIDHVRRLLAANETFARETLERARLWREEHPPRLPWELVGDQELGLKTSTLKLALQSRDGDAIKTATRELSEMLQALKTGGESFRLFASMAPAGANAFATSAPVRFALRPNNLIFLALEVPSAAVFLLMTQSLPIFAAVGPYLILPPLAILLSALFMTLHGRSPKGFDLVDRPVFSWGIIAALMFSAASIAGVLAAIFQAYWVPFLALSALALVLAQLLHWPLMAKVMVPQILGKNIRGSMRGVRLTDEQTRWVEGLSNYRKTLAETLAEMRMNPAQSRALAPAVLQILHYGLAMKHELTVATAMDFYAAWADEGSMDILRQLAREDEYAWGDKARKALAEIERERAERLAPVVEIERFAKPDPGRARARAALVEAEAWLADNAPRLPWEFASTREVGRKAVALREALERSDADALALAASELAAALRVAKDAADNFRLAAAWEPAGALAFAAGKTSSSPAAA